MENFVFMPEGVKLTSNGGRKCDMLLGTCSCGVWHKYSDLSDRLSVLNTDQSNSCYAKIKQVGELTYEDA